MTQLTRRGVGAFAPLALLIASCSMNGPTEALPESGATLEGDVTYNGQKVPVAVIVARKTGGGESSSAFSDEQGHYRILNAPLGPVQIGVNTGPTRAEMSLRARAAGNSATKAQPKPAAKPVELPAKFHNPETSGVATQVDGGVTRFDIVIAK